MKLIEKLRNISATLKKYRRKVLPFAIGALVVFIPVVLFNVLKVTADWYDDGYKYRQKATFTHNANVDEERRITVSMDTEALTADGKMQSSCDDTRFITVGGEKMRYELVSGCGSTNTVYYVVLPSVTSGLNAFYIYYGNPLDYSESDATVSSVTALTPSGGNPTLGAEEDGPSLALYIKFDEGDGVTAHDSTYNRNHATMGPLTPENMKVRQEINIVDGNITDSGDDESLVLLNTANYSGTVTYYFEVVAKVSSGTLTVALERSGTSTQDSTLEFTETSHTLKRSIAFTPPVGETEYNINLSGGTSPEVKSAKIIILQDGEGEPITSTETQIEIGNREAGKTNTTDAPLTSPKYWKYEQDNWDSFSTFTAEVTWEKSQVYGDVTETFTTAGSSSWVCPDTVSTVSVQAWGGGGAGGGDASTGAPAGAGGGGGAYVIGNVAVTEGNSYPYTVGAAGTGGTSTGGPGGDTSFNTSSIIAKGGSGGGANGAAAGAGGLASASTGSTKYNGGTGFQPSSTYGGGGGSSAGTASAGNTATTQTGASAVTDGGPGGNGGNAGSNGSTPATSPGGGGGGGGNRTGSSRSGGAGKAGQLKLSYYGPVADQTITIKIQEDDGNFGNWTDKITLVNAVAILNGVQRIESTPFIPVDGRNYRIVGVTSNSATSYTIYNAKIKIESVAQGYNLYDNEYASLDMQILPGEDYAEEILFNPTGTRVYVAGSDYDAIVQYNLSTPFDISTIEPYKESFTFNSNGSTSLGVAISPNGRKMYLTTSLDDVEEYDIAVPWDITTASYTGYSLDIATIDGASSGIQFNTAGTKMYIIGQTYDSIYQFSLSTAWDIRTATYDTVSFSIATQDTVPEGIVFNSDGTTLLMIGNTSDSVHQYTLSTPWDLSTAAYTTNSYLVNTEETTPNGVYLSPNGTKMYVTGETNDLLIEYNLSTPGNPSTASLSGSKKVIGIISSPRDIYFMPDGDIMFLAGLGRVEKFILTTNWDITTAVYSFESYIFAEESSLYSLDFKPDGTKMYISGFGAIMYEYSLSTPWDITTATYTTNNYTISTGYPISASIENNGTKLYTLTSSDIVYQHTLSTPWDITTATYDSVSFSFVSQSTGSTNIEFNSDGTRMYLLELTNDRVYEYSLSTPWSLSTAAYSNQSFYIGYVSGTANGIFIDDTDTYLIIGGGTTGPLIKLLLDTTNGIDATVNPSPLMYIGDQESLAYDLSISSDGTSVYIIGTNVDTVYQFTLSTPWQINTGSYASKSFYVGGQDATPTGITFSTDGSKMYMSGTTSDDIFQYSLSTPWDVSTASYSSISYPQAQDSDLVGVKFKGDGTKMYTVGNTTDDVFQYSLSTPWNVSTATYEASISTLPSQTSYNLFFSNDGKKVYVLSSSVDEFTLGTAWDITTAGGAVYGIIDHSPANSNTNYGAVLSSDGAYIYSTSTNDIVRQVSVNTESEHISTIETQYLLANFPLASGTSTQDYQTYFDEDEWSGGTTTFTHVSTGANSSTSSVLLQKDAGSTPSNVTGSSVTPSNMSSSSGISLTGQTILGVKATTNNDDIYSSSINTLISMGYGGISSTQTAPEWKTKQFCMNGSCIFFNDSTDVLAIPEDPTINLDKSLRDKFTIQFWVRVNALNPIKSGRLFSKGDNTYMEISEGSTSELLDLYTTLDLGTTNATLTIADGLTLNNWHHVAMGYTNDSDDEIKVYIDGELAGTSTNGVGAPSSDYNNMTMGGESTYNFTGYVDDLKIFREERSLADIQADSVEYIEGTFQDLQPNIGETNSSEYFFTDGLSAYWKMEETSGDATDSSGNTRTLTNNNTTTYVSGKFGNGAEFVPASSQNMSRTGTINDVKTVSFWVNPDNTTNYYINLSDTAYITSTSGTISATGFTSPTIYVNGVATNTISADTWSFVTVTTSTGITADNLSIGKVGSNYFDGTMDEIRIYKKPLTSSQVLSLFNWTPYPIAWWKFDDKNILSAMDSSGNGNTLTIEGATYDRGVYGPGMYIGGSDAHLTKADDSDFDFVTGTSFAISMWIKHNTSSAQEVILSKYNEAGYKVIMEADGDITCALDYDSTWTPTDYVTSTEATYDDNTWHYISCVKEGDTSLKLYIDGILIGTDSSLTSSSLSNSDPIYLGIDSDGTSNDYVGYIDDVRIYNYPTTMKIMAISREGGENFSENKMPDPLGYWKFDEASGTVAHNCGTGKNIDGVLNSIDYISEGIRDRSFGFNYDGTASGVRIADNATLSLTGDLTISAWVRMAYEFSSAARIVDKYSYPSNQLAYYFGKDSDGGACAGNLTFVLSSTAATFNGGVLCATESITPDVWQHVAAVYKAGESMKIYLDGKDVTGSFTTGSAPSSIADSTAVFTIGGIGDGSTGGFPGDIDEVSIYNEALTGDQVKLLALESTGLKIGSTSTDSSGNTTSSYSRELCVPGDTSTCSHPNIGHYKLDENKGTTSIDSSGGSRTITFYGNPEWVPGKVGSAIHLDGVTQYGTIDPGDSRPFSNRNKFTVSAWVKQDILSGGSLLALNASSDLKIETGQEGETPSEMDIAVTINNGTSSQGYTTNAPLETNKWQHWSIVYDGTQSTNADKLKIYLNGIKQPMDFSGTVPSTTTTNTTTLVFGAANIAPYSILKGSIDDLHIYDYPRTTSQISWEYNGGEPYAWYKLDECSGRIAHNSAIGCDGRAKGIDGTIGTSSTGNTSVGSCGSGTSSEMWNNGTTGMRNASLDFDGNENYINLGNYMELELPLTIAAWVKLDSTSGTMPVVTTDSAGGTYYSGAWLNVTDGKVEVGYGDNIACSSSGYRKKIGNTTLSTGTWYYITGVIRSGTDMSVYINGHDAGGTYSGSGGNIDYTTEVATVGKANTCPTGSAYFNGQIDDVKIWTYDLTDNLIGVSMNAGALRFN